MAIRQYTLVDRIIMEVDVGLSSLFNSVRSARLNPAAKLAEPELTSVERRHSEGLMRVNHTGEVCAQALYRGQMLAARSSKTRAMLEQACAEEVDHLAWTQERLHELNGHTSYINAYWYTHSFLMGVIAGMMGDRWSLGFIEETEAQVGAHLDRHLDDLSEKDTKSRKIVEQMREDEARHGQNALAAGGVPLPDIIKQLMTFQSRVMTTLTYFI